MYHAKESGKDRVAVYPGAGAVATPRDASQASAWASTAASSRPVCIAPSAVTAEGQPSQLTGRV